MSLFECQRHWMLSFCSIWQAYNETLRACWCFMEIGTEWGRLELLYLSMQQWLATFAAPLSPQRNRQQVLLDSGGTKAALALTPKSVSHTLTQTSYKRKTCFWMWTPRVYSNAYIFKEYWIAHTVVLSSLDFKYGTDSLGWKEKLIRPEES